MILRAMLPASLSVLTACQAQPSEEAKADVPAAFTSAAADEADECADRQSNLEYTECWQNLAKQTRAKLDAVSEKATKVAQTSDGLERVDLNDVWFSTPVASSISSWAEYSEQQCLAEGRTARGGTGTRALVAKCEYRLNNDRIDELEALIRRIEDY